MTFWLSVGEVKFIIEALQARASRLESYSRFNPDNAAVNDRKAAAMRKLCEKLQRVGTDVSTTRNKLSAKA